MCIIRGLFVYIWHVLTIRYHAGIKNDNVLYIMYRILSKTFVNAGGVCSTILFV